jgi:hypothetical protein
MDVTSLDSHDGSRDDLLVDGLERIWARLEVGRAQAIRKLNIHHPVSSNARPRGNIVGYRTIGIS